MKLPAAVAGTVQYHVACFQKKTLLHGGLGVGAVGWDGGWGGAVRLNELRLLGVFIKAAAKRCQPSQPQRVVIHSAAPTHNTALKTQN